MDFLQNVWASIDWWIVLLVLAAGYFQRYYLKTIKIIGKVVIISAWKTLFISLLFVGFYIWFAKGNGELTPAYKKAAFFSYIFATSFYELLLGPLTWAIEKRVGKPKDDSDQGDQNP